MAKIAKSGTPGAWIVTNNQNSDRGRKSIKNNKVYLNDGEQFEIELYNPLTSPVLCDIKLNGESISKSGLVLRPGQRFYLDCFLDEKKKFIFNTYDVENTNESEIATAKNGLLEVLFYKESSVTLNNWNLWNGDYYTKRSSWGGNNYDVYCGSITTPNVYGGLSNNMNLTNIGTTTTACFDNSNKKDFNFNTSKSIETGRVEKGTKSNQKFDEVDMNFENNYIASVSIQMLPESRKPIEAKEIIRETPFSDAIKKLKTNDNIELIKKLNELYISGILTDDEFSSKKAELLSRI